MNFLAILLSIKVTLPRSRDSNVGTYSLSLDVHLQIFFEPRLTHHVSQERQQYLQDLVTTFSLHCETPGTPRGRWRDAIRSLAPCVQGPSARWTPQYWPESENLGYLLRTHILESSFFRKEKPVCSWFCSRH